MHRVCALAICVICAMAGSTLPLRQAYAGLPQKLVNQKDLRSLMLGPKDIPYDVILHSLETAASREAWPPAGADRSPFWFRQSWLGPPQAWPETLAASYSVTVEVRIMPSAEEAAQAIERLVGSMSVLLRESRDKSLRSFADRAWNAGQGIFFSRKNVAVTVHTSDSEMDTSGLTLKLARLIGRKIDAAAAGKPEPPPKLPQTVRKDLRVCWCSLPLANKLLTRPARNTIILKCGDRPPVAMRVDGLPGKDLTVRLQPLAVLISHKR